MFKVNQKLNLKKLTIRQLMLMGMELTSDWDRENIDFSKDRHYRNRWWTSFFSNDCRGAARLDGVLRTKEELYHLRAPYIAEVKKRLELHKVNFYTVKTYGPDQIKNILDLKPDLS